MTFIRRNVSSVSASRALTKRDAAKQRAEEECKNWINSMNSKLSNEQAPIFLGGYRKPFPFNKEYTALPCLPQSKIQEIEAAIQNGENNRSIGSRFIVSIERVAALRSIYELKERMKLNVPIITNCKCRGKDYIRNFAIS